MKDKNAKATASSARVGLGATSFSSSFGSPPGSSFASASSSISYLAEQPDLSRVSDVQVVVHFKNLAKRDSTTRSRGLEDLQTYVASETEKEQPLEDAFIEAWVKVFPRLSIDASRRVRQLAFALQKGISKTSGKRIARHMPVLAPPWLAGSRDGDKAVARTAHDGLQANFGTQEKQRTLRKAYQGNILSFANDAVNNETRDSLSDPKTTTAEDANAVYYRVICGSIDTVTEMLNVLEPEEVAKHQVEYDHLVGSQKLLNLLQDEVASVRRCVIRFLRTSFFKLKTLFDSHIEQIIVAMTGKRTLRHQSGSSLDFTELLSIIAATYSALWGTDNVFDFLTNLFKQGSQGGPSQSWSNLAGIVESMPENSLPREQTKVAQVMEAIIQGRERREEPAANVPASLRCYFQVLQRLSENLDPDDRYDVAAKYGFTEIKKFVQPEQTLYKRISDQNGVLHILSDALQMPSVQSVAEETWSELVETLVKDIQTSLPAQSKDFESSQRSVGQQGSRLFELQSRVRRAEISERLQDVLDHSHLQVLKESVKVLENRAGKPFGAAECINASLQLLEFAETKHAQVIQESLDQFLENDLPRLLFSPSSTQLITTLHLASNRAVFQTCWSRVLENVMTQNDKYEKNRILTLLLGIPIDTPERVMLLEDAKLQDYLVEQALTPSVTEENQKLLDQILKRSPAVLSDASRDKLLSKLISNLETSPEKPSSDLEGLRNLANRDPILLKQHLSSESTQTLIQQLLRCQEAGADDEALIAAELLTMVDSSAMASEGGKSDEHLIHTIHKSLIETSTESLSVATLVNLASQKYVASPSSTLLKSLLPDIDRWRSELQPFLQKPLPPSFAITDSLGATLSLVRLSAQNGDLKIRSQIDSDGYSSLLRMSLYSMQLLSRAQSDAGSLPQDMNIQREIVVLLLTAQIAGDGLSMHAENELWKGVEANDDIIQFRKSVKDVTAPVKSEQAKQISDQLEHDWFSLDHGLSPEALHFARAWVNIKSEEIAVSGWNKSSAHEVEGKVAYMWKDEDQSVPLAAHLAAFSAYMPGSSTLLKIVNEAIAQLTGLDGSKVQNEFRKLAMLSLILSNQSEILDSVPKQRLVFFVKNVVPWLSGSLSEVVKATLCQVLTQILPQIADVYGEDWEKILEYLASSWLDAEGLDASAVGSPIIFLRHSSLKLFAMLISLLNDEETNDDLKDAWKEKLDDLGHGLANLLTQLGHLPDESNQPLRATNEVLARQIKAVPASRLGNLTGLYSLLNTHSREVQQTVFDILHRQIPRDQEELSVNVALDKSTAHLPEELLSLVTNHPSADAWDDIEADDRLMPSPLFAYLGSWLLVFDHFNKASEKVRSDYVLQIKETNINTALLHIIFTQLGHAAGKPLDASKFDVTLYSFDIEKNPKRDVQWLLAHLYYLCLSRLPSLTKSWWLDCKSRAIRAQVEPWTEKYFSQLVINDVLKVANEWVKTQDSSADDALSIKVGAKDVIVAKEIDTELLSMAVRLPTNFPLGQVAVESINRVGVDEKKWRSWLLNTQGVIAFSDNSIADGLVAFKKNVAGKFSGQTECAICYSVISQDKQLPTKKCRTCKNQFHGSCLFRWFKSSNSSSCPLCRTAFHYG